MYTYAKKYKANKVILVYPFTENFPEDQTWQFEDNISLSIISAELSSVIEIKDERIEDEKKVVNKIEEILKA